MGKHHNGGFYYLGTPVVSVDMEFVGRRDSNANLHLDWDVAILVQISLVNTVPTLTTHRGSVFAHRDTYCNF
ncbi:hypothetical protein GCM10025859_46100 [Alicyclobacillus fastidiosus]|nr:hypothetical protein GCM10025859_46100 [Alicyclobacillus fastidiosus]